MSWSGHDIWVRFKASVVLADATPSITELDGALKSDLDSSNHGLRWMRCDFATKILVSDYLVGAIESITANLRESRESLERYHLVLQKIEKRATTHTRRAERRGESPGAIGPPLPDRDLEFLQRDLAVTSFFRAIGSTFDNLGIAIAVLAGLRINVVERLTWPKLLTEGWKNLAVGLQGSRQAEIRDAAIQAVADLGPEGWLSWAMGMRNMLVHRPRRIWTTQLGTVRDGKGRLIAVRHLLMLPREPELSDVEMFRAGGEMQESLLPEPAQETMGGVLGSTTTLVEAVGLVLLRLLEDRRQNPDAFHQPPVQWRDKVLPSRPMTLFQGYRPDYPMPSATALVMNPLSGERFKAAAVMKGEADHWPHWLALQADLHEKDRVAHRSRSGRRRKPPPPSPMQPPHDHPA